MTSERFKNTWRFIRAGIFTGIILAILLIIFMVGVLTYAKIQGPPPLAVPQTTLIYAGDSTIIGESHNGQERYWVPLNEMAPSLVNATISIEDKRFFEHKGLDFKRIVGALLADIKAMAKVQGASTITMQYARNLFLEHDKTWMRKIQESLYALRLEMSYTKQQILEGYLNTIYYGDGTYGVEAAARHYFGKPANELSLAESSMLAGVPKGPSYYSPFKNFEKAKNRQKIILQSMVENNYITQYDADTAYSSLLKFNDGSKYKVEAIAPYFQDIVNEILHSKLGIEQRVIELGGLRVYTTLDIQAQRIAEKQLADTIAANSDIQAAFVALDPKTGAVKALIGGRDYVESPFNRAVQAVRQPGSTFKPFLYYAALSQGFTPSTELRSERTTFLFDDGRSKYTPQNYNNYYADGPITMAQALALSDNVYAVKTYQMLNEMANDTQLVKTAKQFGITSPLKSVPSLALGTSPVRLLEMVNAYGMLANGGKNIKPVFITKVVNYRGDVIFEHKSNEEQALDSDLAFITTHMMTGMFDEKLNDYTSVTGRTIIPTISRPYAGKSGSTSTDSWMIGYSPQVVAGVWTGYDKDRTIDLIAERQYSKQIWAGFMEQVLESEPVIAFRPSENVVGVYVNPDNGLLATEDCPVSRLTYFLAGTEPTQYCTVHIKDEPGYIEENETTPEKEKGIIRKILDWFL
ncbi:PBP1A family penicillin-binding protein [Bacillus sp. HMF5848]|nr:PBP1A family penicillin-binding protein [Bacillus sp. HMF5848]RSK29465.1 PBP1A family penicillin-binding protein [Bacillus sp. HMF5848]